MKLLLTGGTGFIGRRYIERFSHHEFTVLVRDLNRAREVLPSSVECIDSLDKLVSLDDYDGVINLAGEPIIDKRWSQTQKSKICQSRWGITQQIVSLVQASTSPPKVFLSGSAIGVYGNHGDQQLTESISVNATDFPSTLCVRWEEIAAEVKSNVRVVHLRTGIVLDKEQGALSKMLLPYKMGLGGPLGNGQQYMSWIHIDDILSAIEFLLENSKVSGPVNLVSPGAVTNREFSNTLASQLRRFAIMRMPKWVLNLILGESSVLLLDSQRVIPDKLLSNGFQFKYPSLEKTMAHLLG